MSSYEIVNIYDMIDALGEDVLQGILSDFSCPKNSEIENFVRHKAIDFAKRKISVTYFVIADSKIYGIFALYHKVITLTAPKLSNNNISKLKRYSQYNENTDTYTASAFLISQFGKNYAINDDAIDGNLLMHCTLSTLRAVQRSIGGGIVYLDCEKKISKLKEFYSRKPNYFTVFGERCDDGIEYLQMFRFL